MRRKERTVIAGFMVVLSIVLGAAVFILLAFEYCRDRNDYRDLATMEAKIILRTVVVAIQTTAGMRADLQDAGVPTNVIHDVVAKCGTGRMLQRLGLHGMFDYLVCQDDEGIVAGYGAGELSSIDTDPFLAKAMKEDMFRTRELTGSAARIEAVLPFMTDKGREYLLRVCISLGSIREIEQRKKTRMILFGGAMVMVTLLFVTYLFSLHTTRVLARERDAITDEVRRIQEQLRQQERASAMGRFAAVVAHEVRNPLNAIQILVQRLERETKPVPESAAKFTEFTRVIRDEMKRLDRIVEDFLEFSRAKPPACVATDPVMLMKDICCLAQGVLQERNIVLRQDLGPCVPAMMDPVQMKQALVNVLKNAAEATPAEGEVAVKIRQSEGKTVFRVEDSGRGFTAAEREHAFDLLYSSKEGGSGIGLAVTRRIVEQHGGTIMLHARVPHGAVVEITIPTQGVA